MVNVLLPTILLLSSFLPSTLTSQTPLMPLSPSFDLNTGSLPSNTLADILTTQTRASIFYDYLRTVKELQERISGDGVKSTLFVPVNKAVLGLERKPHESPSNEDTIEISEQAYDERSRRNVERWVSGHIIPISPITFSESTSYQTLSPEISLSFKRRSSSSPSRDPNDEWKEWLLNPDIEIVGHLKAANGDIYLIDGTVKE